VIIIRRNLTESLVFDRKVESIFLTCDLCWITLKAFRDSSGQCCCLQAIWYTVSLMRHIVYLFHGCELLINFHQHSFRRYFFVKLWDRWSNLFALQIRLQ